MTEQIEDAKEFRSHGQRKEKLQTVTRAKSMEQCSGNPRVRDLGKSHGKVRDHTVIFRQPEQQFGIAGLGR
jgi:hypothetical protein